MKLKVLPNFLAVHKSFFLKGFRSRKHVAVKLLTSKKKKVIRLPFFNSLSLTLDNVFFRFVYLVASTLAGCHFCFFFFI